ncbi:hypothetical protein BU17DRAFT_85270 [Hysterangium stoloniferum]|nr:hypothetical protein BU17DRAFT_85270 [Hysterangium stoloniferum]
MSNFIIPIPHWQACDPTSGSWGLFQEMQNKTDLADSKQTLGLGFSGDGYILSAYRKDGIDVLTLESELYYPMGSGKPPDNSKRPPYVLLLDLPSPLISMNFSTSTNFDFTPFPGIPEDFDQLEIHPDIIDNRNINADIDNCAEQVFSESYGGACNSNGFIAPAGSAGIAEFYQAQSQITSQAVRAYTENPGPLLPMPQYLQENGVNNRRDNQAPTFPVLPGLENSPPINPTGSASQPQKNSGHALVSSLRARRDIQPRQQRVPMARPAPYTIPLVHRAHSLDVSALPTLTNRPHYLNVPPRTSTKHTQPPHLQAHAAPSITNTQTHMYTSPSPNSSSLVTDHEDFQKESKTLQWDGRTFASGDREAKAVIGAADALFKLSLLTKYMFPEVHNNILQKAASDAWFTGQLNIKREVVIPLDSNIISYLCRNARSHRNTLAKGVRDDIIGTFNLHEHKELNVRLNVIQTLSSNAVFIYEKVRLTNEGRQKLSPQGKPMRSGEWHHPCIKKAMMHIVFKNRNSHGAQHPDIFQSMPLETIAFCCIAIKHALDYEASHVESLILGRATDDTSFAFDGRVYDQSYRAYMKSLQEFQRNHYSYCSTLQEKLWIAGSNKLNLSLQNNHSIEDNIVFGEGMDLAEYEMLIAAELAETACPEMTTADTNTTSFTDIGSSEDHTYVNSHLTPSFESDNVVVASRTNIPSPTLTTPSPTLNIPSLTPNTPAATLDIPSQTLWNLPEPHLPL